MINVVKCNNATRHYDESPCKSEEEIQNWLRRKFLLTVNNQKRFEQVNYGKESLITNVAHLKWNPIQSTERKEIVNEIQIQEI